MSDPQVRGMMLGLAIGDALGMPTEFLSLAEIRRRYGPQGLQTYVHGKGFFTDDTQMSMAVAEALIEAGNRPLEELMPVVVEKFISWRHSPDNFRAPGVSTLLAIDRLEGGKSWRESGSRNSKGCGSVMRTAPLGYFYRGDPVKMKEAAHAIGAATHAHPTADAACLAASYAVGLAFSGVPAADWPARISNETKGISPEFDETGRRLLEALELPDEEQGMELIGKRFQGWTADEVLACALYCVLRHPNDFRACLVRAVNNDGDSDSIGCVAGALQGARLGAAAIPKEWLEGIERREDLEKLADRLALKN